MNINLKKDPIIARKKWGRLPNGEFGTVLKYLYVLSTNGIHDSCSPEGDRRINNTYLLIFGGQRFPKLLSAIRETSLKPGVKSPGFKEIAEIRREG